MPFTITWADIGWRLGLAVLAGIVLGFNRSERGMAAGLRTTLLVTLAAAVAMVQVNLLLDTRGKTPDSFITNDLMRLPLGILTGVGFIGAGAILRRGEMVIGVTTAATLWMATVVGLCFGGGQLGLGAVATGVAAAALWGLKLLELQLVQERRGSVIVTLSAGGPSADDVHQLLLGAGFNVAIWDVTHQRRAGAERRVIKCELRWRGKPQDTREPEVIRRLVGQPGVEAVRWKA